MRPLLRAFAESFVNLEQDGSSTVAHAAWCSQACMFCGGPKTTVFARRKQLSCVCVCVAIPPGRVSVFGRAVFVDACRAFFV